MFEPFHHSASTVNLKSLAVGTLPLAPVLLEFPSFFMVDTGQMRHPIKLSSWHLTRVETSVSCRLLLGPGKKKPPTVKGMCDWRNPMGFSKGASFHSCQMPPAVAAVCARLHTCLVSSGWLWQDGQKILPRLCLPCGRLETPR